MRENSKAAWYNGYILDVYNNYYIQTVCNYSQIQPHVCLSWHSFLKPRFKYSGADIRIDPEQYFLPVDRPCSFSFEVANNWAACMYLQTVGVPLAPNLNYLPPCKASNKFVCLQIDRSFRKSDHFPLLLSSPTIIIYLFTICSSISFDLFLFHQLSHFFREPYTPPWRIVTVPASPSTHVCFFERTETFVLSLLYYFLSFSLQFKHKAKAVDTHKPFIWLFLCSWLRDSAEQHRVVSGVFVNLLVNAERTVPGSVILWQLETADSSAKLRHPFHHHHRVEDSHHTNFLCISSLKTKDSGWSLSYPYLLAPSTRYPKHWDICLKHAAVIE